ncbi:MAG TPA: hypothetical protein VJJ23_05730 [Candidatus Nanoarchaeia archaeon]|nr:hypothetical protein [Candidatus Nanoarchaeia archaeon]
MPIIGLNFDKIEVERIRGVQQNMEIKPNIDISEISDEKLPMANANEVLKVSFSYGINYEPNIGHVSFKGHALLLEDPKTIKEIMKKWNKEKKIQVIPDKILEQLFNGILSRCNIKALTLTQEVNLPPHIPMPQLIKTEKMKDKNYIG